MKNKKLTKICIEHGFTFTDTVWSLKPKLIVETTQHILNIRVYSNVDPFIDLISYTYMTMPLVIHLLLADIFKEQTFVMTSFLRRCGHQKLQPPQTMTFGIHLQIILFSQEVQNLLQIQKSSNKRSLQFRMMPDLVALRKALDQFYPRLRAVVETHGKSIKALFG